ncbi:MAG: AraC family transcriptional regulator of adaptative response [Cognaticolwellia sp.]
MIRFLLRSCSLGHALVAWSSQGVVHLSLGDDPKALKAWLLARFSKAKEAPSELLSSQALAVVDGHSSELPPLDLRGTVFQQKVWQALLKIPAGETRSYTQLAATLELTDGNRAVASACAQNTLAVLVPCHRVTPIDRDLAGYRWGMERKRKLLEREGAIPEQSELF